MKKLLYLLLLVPLWVQGQDCKGVKQETDQFTGDVKYSMPMKYKWVRLYKHIITENKQTLYFMYLETGCSTPIFGEGVTLLFEDGSKIELADAKVKTNVHDSYVVSSYFELSSDQIKQLAEKPLKAFRLYFKDREYKDDERLMEFAQCLINSPPNAN